MSFRLTAWANTRDRSPMGTRFNQIVSANMLNNPETAFYDVSVSKAIEAIFPIKATRYVRSERNWIVSIHF